MISAILTVRFMMMQGASSEVDMILNIGMGIVLAIAEVVFAAMLVYLYNINRYFLSVLFLFVTGPLVVTSIIASNLQLLDSRAKTEHYAMANDAGYNALLQMQKGYSEQIAQIRAHPYYNEHNPINKKHFDEQISVILAEQRLVSQQIASFNPATLESGNGFQVMGEWLGMSANQFKQKVFFAASILLEAVMLLCTIFLTVTSPSVPSVPSRPSTRPRKGFFKNLFSSFKLPSIVQQPTAQPGGARALNIQENNKQFAKNIPEYSMQEYPMPKPHALNLNVGHYIAKPNENLIVNLAKFPHLIVAGLTGSGKSSFLKGLLTQLISQNSPKDVKILPIDLKSGATLFKFRDAPHLEKPLVSSKEEVLKYLDYLLAETKRRQKFLTSHSCEDIEEYYNEHGKLPFHFLVAIFEEVALLIDYGKNVAMKVAEVTATGRSAGVHAILCTQYPKASVLDTKITANCPARVCFQMENANQSRVVLDEPGAEKLSGPGHAIFKHGVHRFEIKTPFYSKEQIQSIVTGAIKQHGENIPQSNIIPFPKNIQNIQENIPETEDIPDKNIPIADLAKKLRQEGKKQVEIGNILGIPQGTVSKLLRKSSN